jgi:fucose permease
MGGCLLGGFVTDEVGLKPVLLATWVGVIASLAGCGLAGSFLLLVVAYALLGVASGVLETGLNILPAQVGGGTGLMNVIHMGFGVGALCAPLIAGYVLAAGGSWRLPYWLIAVVPAVLLIRALPIKMPAAPRYAGAHEERQPILRLLRHPLVLLSAAGLLFYVAAELSISNWIVLYMGQRFVLPPMQASLALSVYWGFILVGRLLQGPLNRLVSLPALIISGALTFGLGILGVAQAPSSEIAFAALVLTGLGASGLYPNIMIYANRRYQRQIGAVTGVLSMTAAAGSFAFQPIIGRVAELYGLRIGFLGLVGCTVLVALSYLPVWLGKVRE